MLTAETESLTQTDQSIYTPIVARVMQIEDLTTGDARKNFLLRYRGVLRGDSSEAYDQLAASLRPLNITPLFRIENGRHTILLMEGVINPGRSNPWINVILFVLTLFSMIFSGAIQSFQGPVGGGVSGFLSGVLNGIWSGLPFAASLLAILMAHEFGHYLAGRYHRTHVTLPYFLPFPLSPFGTLGAFIQLKEPPRNRRVLLDIGIAGPLAGLIVAIPVLLIGLSLSYLDPIEIPGPGQGIQLEGNSLLYLLSKLVVFGQLLPAPESYGGLSPAAYWIRYFFTGQPLPIGGLDVMIHPVAFAGWAGLLVTALNLIPAGQLDGGHLLYVLFGRRARALLPFILAALILLGLVWSGWWLWAFLIFVMGRVHAEPLDQITQLDTRRKVLAVVGLLIFFLVFTPVPLVIAMG